MRNEERAVRLRQMAATILPAVIWALLFTGSAMAAWNAVGHAINLLTAASYRTQIEEQYQAPGKALPSQSVDKIVNVRNTGTTDAMIRVRIEKAFGSLAEDGSFLADPSLDPSVILLHVDETGMWKQQEDDWYYYAEILKAGETTKVPLMDSYSLSENMSNAYKGKEGRIFVRMESVQAGAAASEWEKAVKDLGLAYQEAMEDSVVGVTLKGEEGFSFEAQDTDLFANFKNLTPGCCRTQIVKVDNQSEGRAEIFLRAEAIDQDQMEAKEAELVKKILSEYAQIELRCGDDLLYQGSVDGNLDQEEGSMALPISLGVFAQGEEKKLTVSLSMSPEMEIDAMSLLGKVHWVFSAEGSAKEYPYTGDDSPIRDLILLMGACLVLAIPAMILLAGRKNREDGQ